MSPTLRITGEDVLFCHWPVPASSLERVVPDPLEIDTFDGSGWVTALAHDVTEAALAPVSVSPLPTFGEVEFRTYVTHDGDDSVHFFSCDTGQQFASLISDQLFSLPYYPASVGFERRDETRIVRSRRRQPGNARFDATFRPTGTPTEADPGSLGEFLVERHAYYDVVEEPTSKSEGEIVVGHVERDPWQLSEVDARVRTNTLFQSVGLETPDASATFHYSPGFVSRLVSQERVAVE